MIILRNALAVKVAVVIVPAPDRACRSIRTGNIARPAVVPELLRLIAGVAPPLDTIGAVPVTAVTGAVPDAANVIRPLASTVNETLV